MPKGFPCQQNVLYAEISEIKSKVHIQVMALQQTLGQTLPDCDGPKEFRDFRDTLIELDRILQSGIERNFIIRNLEENLSLSAVAFSKLYYRKKTTLRFCILLSLTACSSRRLAIAVSHSILFQEILRKKIFMQMKHLITIIKAHGQRYKTLFDNHCYDSDLTVNEANVILHRLQSFLDQVPLAIEQASQRIVLHLQRINIP